MMFDNWTLIFIIAVMIGAVLWVIGWPVSAAFFVGASAGASLYRWLKDEDK
jgi:small-conductance mechanosensitive channel